MEGREIGSTRPGPWGGGRDRGPGQESGPERQGRGRGLGGRGRGGRESGPQPPAAPWPPARGPGPEARGPNPGPETRGPGPVARGPGPVAGALRPRPGVARGPGLGPWGPGRGPSPRARGRVPGPGREAWESPGPGPVAPAETRGYGGSRVLGRLRSHFAQAVFMSSSVGFKGIRKLNRGWKFQDGSRSPSEAQRR